MTDRDRSDRLSEYVEVLRGFGLTEADIRSRHGLDDTPDGGDLVDQLDDALEAVTEQAMYDHTHDALADSTRGIDADRETEDHVDSLAAVLADVDWDLTVDGTDPLELTVTDPAGESRFSTFDYPDHPLGPTNYPALVDAVESLLDGLSFVLLTETDGRWRFVLLSEEDLRALRDRYGERIRVFRRPLLAADQPADFAEGPDGDDDREGELAGLAGDAFAESFGTGPRVHRSSRPLDEDSSGTAGPKTVVGESVDDVFEAIEGGESSDSPASTKRDTATTSGGSDDSEAGTADAGPSDRLVGGGPRTEVVQGGVDDVFDDADEETRSSAESDGPELTAEDETGVADSPAAEADVAGESGGPDPDAAARVADLAAAAAEVGPSKTSDDAASDDGAAEVGENEEEATDDDAVEADVADGVSADATTGADSVEPASTPESEPAPGMESTPDSEEAPEDSPSISDVDLDIGDFEEPDLSDGETNTDGPLAGNLGGPAMAAGDEAETTPVSSNPDHDEADESKPGLVGRFTAWLRGLF
ncbi:hypothetical protein [Haloarchaeobius sp. DT45]|uniref:hypothetical protein n=1 Tax=Haloarchaeobius sp. DT45 TaxID=3446116 RepID=UPI003F6B4BB4